MPTRAGHVGLRARASSSTPPPRRRRREGISPRRCDVSGRRRRVCISRSPTPSGRPRCRPRRSPIEVAPLLSNGFGGRTRGERVRGSSGLVGRVRASVPGRAGSAIRVHGDFHLRRVMRREKRLGRSSGSATIRSSATRCRAHVALPTFRHADRGPRRHVVLDRPRRPRGARPASGRRGRAGRPLAREWVTRNRRALPRGIPGDPWYRPAASGATRDRRGAAHGAHRRPRAPPRSDARTTIGVRRRRAVDVAPSGAGGPLVTVAASPDAHGRPLRLDWEDRWTT